MLAAIYKRLKGVDPATGDAVCGDVDGMARYISERTGLSSPEVVAALERGETLETNFALYRAADRAGNLMGAF
jgi:hypothetical protein